MFCQRRLGRASAVMTSHPLSLSSWFLFILYDLPLCFHLGFLRFHFLHHSKSPTFFYHLVAHTHESRGKGNLKRQMVFGIITATAICPAISATKQSIEGGIKGNRRAGNKSLDLEVFVTFEGGGVGDPGEAYKGKFEGAEVVLGEDGKVG